MARVILLCALLVAGDVHAQTFSFDSLKPAPLGGGKSGTFSDGYVLVTPSGVVFVGSGSSLVTLPYESELRNSWGITCRTDQMTDLRTCSATHIKGIFVFMYGRIDSVSVSLGSGQARPATGFMLRFDDRPVVSSAGPWKGAEARRMLAEIAGASRIRMRYTEEGGEVNQSIEGTPNKLMLDVLRAAVLDRGARHVPDLSETPTAARSGEFAMQGKGSLRVDRTWSEHGYANALVTYRNDTQNTFATVVTIRCNAFNSSGAKIGTQDLSFWAHEHGPMRFGFTGTLSIPIELNGATMSKVECGIEQAR